MSLKEKEKQKQIVNNNIESDFSSYKYVFASTLNQMVNYIPWKKYGFQESYALTVKGSSEFNNEKWNEYLENVIGKQLHEIEISQQSVLSIDDIVTTLEKALPEDNPIFCNVTGGQRPFLFAVTQVISKRKNSDDRICYLEGNTNRLMIMKPDWFLDKPIVDEFILEEDMTIEIALRLMGFPLQKNKILKAFHSEIDEDKKAFYINIFYPEYLKNEGFRKELSNFNTNQENKVAREANYENVIDGLVKCSTLTKAQMCLHWSKYKTRKAFGYILEELAAYIILDSLKKHDLLNKVADMHAGLKISAEYYENDSNIDEFDILLLTKSGKLINFECKSGGMSGDNAKSNKYSTYAIAGVYGLPILISPALSKDVPKNFLTKDIKSAYKSAQRANLDVWCINEIEDKIKEKLT